MKFMLLRIFKIFLFISIISILLIFITSLFKFKETILSLKKFNDTESSNIVILTGGTNRIKDGLKIVKGFNKTRKINFKILVSGTGKGFSKKSLINQIEPNFNPDLIECCIDLDSVSKNTFTNAIETSKWAHKNNINKFILITSNYHMPRAILEFKNIMPNKKIHTFPIKPKKHNIANWLNSYQTFNLVFKEFCKYIFAAIRIKISNL